MNINEDMLALGICGAACIVQLPFGGAVTPRLTSDLGFNPPLGVCRVNSGFDRFRLSLCV